VFLLNKRNDSGFFAWYVSAFGLVTVSGCLGLLARVFFWFVRVFCLSGLRGILVLLFWGVVLFSHLG